MRLELEKHIEVRRTEDIWIETKTADLKLESKVTELEGKVGKLTEQLK